MKKKKYNFYLDSIRKNIIKLTHKAKSSHIGSCYSIVEILFAIYELFKLDPKKNNIKYQFILSKGHACLALYCVLYHFKIINKKLLFSFGNENSLLMQHASHNVPGITVSTGSLGHGLPIAVGMALSSKLSNSKKKIIVLISDGELNEGSTWEAILFASHHKLKNLIVIVDYNKLQSLTSVKKTLNIEPLTSKFRSFGCNTKLVNGHDLPSLKKSISTNFSNRPLIIIANTIKGKGISFMENKISWHYKSPSDNELKKGLLELN